MPAFRVIAFAALLTWSSPAWGVPITWQMGVGGNGHSYDVVSGSLSFDEAVAAANAAGGYLVTVTSQAENDFLVATFGSTPGLFWMGASDAATEDEWRWVTGPEAGTQFWQGGVGGSATPPFNFARWGSTEPNDSANEDYGLIALAGAFLPAGEWADANAAGSAGADGYLIEFAAVPEPAVALLVAAAAGALIGIRRLGPG
jgi:Lectin C-type domain